MGAKCIVALNQSFYSNGAVGRSYADAPEVDGKVYLSDYFDAKPGDIIWVQIIHADEYDLFGAGIYHLGEVKSLIVN